MTDIIIPVVDVNDRVVGFKPRSKLDYGRDIYRVCSVWVTNGKNELLLAQRSFDKKIYPGMWDVAVAGTVEKDETYEETAKRELYEELGITNRATIGPKVRVEGAYNMFIQWFFLKLDGPAETFAFQKSEIEKLKWYPRGQLITELRQEPWKFMANGRDMLRWIDLFWQ
jgi:isopentenyldiphosphate isomerase